MPKFEKGELVRLKSGGPTMTVDRQPGEASGYSRLSIKGLQHIMWDMYRCVWFDGNELKAESFEEYLLVSVSDAAAEK